MTKPKVPVVYLAVKLEQASLPFSCHYGLFFPLFSTLLRMLFFVPPYLGSVNIVVKTSLCPHRGSFEHVHT